MPAVVEVAPEDVAVDIPPVPADLPLAGEEGQTETAQVEQPDDVSPATYPEQIDEQVAESAQAKKPQPTAAAETAAAKPPGTTTEESWASYLLYILGALLLAIAGFVFARRNSVEKDESLPARSLAPTEDVFADVRLQDQILEVEAAVEEPAAVEKSVLPKPDNRGYGERRHDEYASDVDAADALAEADIYIAYGRHPQAIDLLDNALVAEPGNPVYRLKLLEIYTELDNQSAAMAQLQKIMEIGDPDSTARAEAMIEGLGVDEIDELELPSATAHTPVDRGPGLSPNPLDIFTDSDETLEEVFSGLEIEEEDEVGEEDDLDLSTDFTDDNDAVYDDEELVIAADSDALSTKLDLARAYLDMGDEDGARQILDEVVAEGSEELKAEAQTLLDRIG
jgi:pilus assembly protein FimV